jgi:EAL domain-containing protein (putative c-di-GMP-specific phosphodiesterase class I)
MAQNNLLIMDDDLDVSTFFRDVAESLGYQVRVLNDSAYFIETVEKFKPGLIILDLQMPKHDGIELLRRLGERGSDAKIFIGSGVDPRVLKTAEQLGRTLGLKIAGTFIKPIEAKALKAMLRAHRQEERVLSADELSNAIETGEIVVHYLPKVTRHADGRWLVDGVEALVRWRHPQHGLISPGEFLPMAEQSGLIVHLTDYVFRAAMEQARVWFSKGLYVELGLNLSANFLSDLEFPDRLVALIREKGLDPSMVMLELSETSSLVDPELAMDILARLRVKRVNLCLDDFGVGHSSLTHLYRMPFSEVKIDNAFINDMRTSEDARHTVEGLTFLAHKLNMQLCAEGVEDEEMFRILEEIGCDRIQGHYIGPALPARELVAIAESWNARYPEAGQTESA